ncbi:hypothetical protein SO802_028852 [Lithocarpus litseifolius]|uniref:Myb/SANT-like domain-containing protein n=1 Tax=Lithocarpus litseifolius TaxID=425828 RepID=A0AAW2BSE1_9ROSI
MAHESQEADEKKWPPHVEHIFIDIMLEEQLKGNMPNGVFKGPTWAAITAELNQRTGKDFLSKQVQQKHNRLRPKQRKWSQLLRHTKLGWDELTQIVTCSDEVWQNVIAGCPNYPSLQQLFAPSTATGNLQISSNTPPLNSDEERALEEELANANANASAPTHMDDDCYTPNFESFPQGVEDAEVEEVTQRAGKHPVQDARVRRSRRSQIGCSSSTDQFAESAIAGDPCSLNKAMAVLNSSLMAYGNDWIRAVEEYDFDDAYFNDVGSSNDCEDNDDDWTDSEFEREEEAEFNLVNPIVGEMYTYMQRHYDKQPMRTSALTDQAYIDEVTEGNPAKCYEMLRMTPELLLHLVDELTQHGHLVDGLGGVNATQAMAMLLYILGHNTRYRCVADRFQHSTETVCRHFRKALRAVHHYAKHVIKPDQNVTGLPEHLQVNKYWPWFERCVGAIDGMHVSARPPANATQAHRDRKSLITTNVLCVCNMDMQFTFVHSRWEGSANDSRVFEEAISDQKHGFPWPPTGSYYMVDSGLQIGTSFLPLTSPLGTMRRNSTQAARFPILNLMPNFKPVRQRYVIVVCCALHNFIHMNSKSDELFRTIGESVGEGSATNRVSSGDAGASTSSATQRHVLEMSSASKRSMGQFRENITDAMWDDYVARGNVR